MLSISLFVIALNAFILYPGFVDPKLDIQMAIDKGPIVELVIACRPGEGIISFSKLDRAYCIPDATCYSSLEPAIKHLCR